MGTGALLIAQQYKERHARRELGLSVTEGAQEYVDLGTQNIGPLILYRVRSISVWAGRLTGSGPVTWCVLNGVGGYAGVFRVDLPPGGHVRAPCHDASATSWVSAHGIFS